MAAEARIHNFAFFLLTFYFPRHLYICRESSTNPPFLQTQFPKSPNERNFLYNKELQQRTTPSGSAKTNPIKPNFNFSLWAFGHRLPVLFRVVSGS
jgi:hypothetical protein